MCADPFVQNLFKNGRIFSLKTVSVINTFPPSIFRGIAKQPSNFELCWNSRHTTAMHPDSDQEHNSSSATGFKVDGGEKKISTKFLLNLQWIVNVLNSVDKLSVEDLVLKLFICQSLQVNYTNLRRTRGFFF